MAGETREEHHTKILAFLTGEFARTEGRQCIRVGLYYRSPGAGDEDLYSRDRQVASEADWFTSTGMIEKMVREMLDRAEQHANSFTTSAKARRFFIRTEQHLGGRQTFSFSLQPTQIVSFDDDDDDGDGPSRGAGSADGNALLGDAFKTLVRVNAGMFDGGLKSLSTQLTAAVKENAELNAENRLLRQKNDELVSERMEREWRIQKEMKVQHRVDQGIERVFELAPIVAGRLLGGTEILTDAPDAMEMFVAKFLSSIDPQQGPQILALCRQDQQMMLYEMDQLVKKRAAARAAKAEAKAKAAGGANAATEQPQQGNNGTPPPTT